MRRVAGYALALALSWLAVMAGGMFIPGAAPSALVLWPGRDFLTRLPPEARLVDAAGRFGITVTGVPAAALYRAGAGLVLPAGLPLCVEPGRGPKRYP